jgi:N6-adenosine-specific RNA methylase IME4
MKNIQVKLENQEWYQGLVKDCRAIITEAVFTSRWALVEGYWNLGERIENDDNFKKFSKGNQSSLQDLAKNLSISERTLYYARQAYNKFPKLDKIPEGKNISWNKLITLYLPAPKEINIPLPKGKYNVFLADPPWTYNNTGVDGAVDKEYPTMTIEQLCEMPVRALTADNSVLFLWTTNPILEECFPVIKSWGFGYKTNLCWIKKNKRTGIGFYVRGVHELLLICVKGQMLPEHIPLSIIEEEAREHSRKPEIYGLIEQMYPNCKYIELFARNKEKRINWTYYGNEAK